MRKSTNMKKLTLLTLAAFVATSAFATTSYELTRSKTTAERDFNATVFSAVARIGDSSLCNQYGDWEQGLGPNTNEWTQKRSNDFDKCKTKNFEVKYTASTGKVAFTLAGNILEYRIDPTKTIGGLVVGTKSAACTTVNIDCLVFNNENLGAAYRPTVTNGDGKFLRITGTDFTQDWKLKGTIAMCWQGTPRNNQMQMEVKGMQAVPEPGTMIAVAAGISALLARKRKKA